MRRLGSDARREFLDGLRAKGDDGASEAEMRVLSDEFYREVPPAYYPSRDEPVHVCLGADVNACDWDFIRSGGVRGGRGSVEHPHFGVVVNAAGRINAPCYFEAHPNIRYYDKNLMDEEGQEVTTQDLDDFADEIEGGVQAGKCVFVHCLEGKSRSAMAFIAWLGKYRHKGYDESLRLLQAQRRLGHFKVEPNVTFERALRRYIANVQAEAETDARAAARAEVIRLADGEGARHLSGPSRPSEAQAAAALAEVRTGETVIGRRAPTTIVPVARRGAGAAASPARAHGGAGGDMGVADVPQPVEITGEGRHMGGAEELRTYYWVDFDDDDLLELFRLTQHTKKAQMRERASVVYDSEPAALNAMRSARETGWHHRTIEIKTDAPSEDLDENRVMLEYLPGARVIFGETTFRDARLPTLLLRNVCTPSNHEMNVGRPGREAIEHRQMVTKLKALGEIAPGALRQFRASLPNYTAPFFEQEDSASAAQCAPCALNNLHGAPLFEYFTKPQDRPSRPALQLEGTLGEMAVSYVDMHQVCNLDAAEARCADDFSSQVVTKALELANYDVIEVVNPELAEHKLRGLMGTERCIGVLVMRKQVFESDEETRTPDHWVVYRKHHTEWWLLDSAEKTKSRFSDTRWAAHDIIRYYRSMPDMNLDPMHYCVLVVNKKPSMAYAMDDVARLLREDRKYVEPPPPFRA